MDQLITPANLPSIVWQQANVITTDLLATLYGTDAKSIRMNYSRNESRFEEGKHFHKLEGVALRDFKDRATDSSSVVGKNARSLLLWTERGAARHAKMVETGTLSPPVGARGNIFSTCARGYWAKLGVYLPALRRRGRRLSGVANDNSNFRHQYPARRIEHARSR